MYQILHNKPCPCNSKEALLADPESIEITHEQLSKEKKKERLFPYPGRDESKYETFQIKYEKKLSLRAKIILNSFHNKYLYYAIDDILYSFETNVNEQKDLLAILYSPVISLQNNFSINFFDIWIKEVYINEISDSNRFCRTNNLTSEPTNYITIKLHYIKKLPAKKQESLW